MSTQKEVKSPDVKSFTGRLGGDPEKKIIAEKHLDLVEFSIATKNGEETQWITVSAGGELKKLANGLKKGELVTVLGAYSEKEGTKGKTFYNLRASEITRKEQEIFKGNLTDAPEVKKHEGKSILEFSIANNDNGEKPVYHKIVFWGDRADEYIKENLQKADFVSIVGYRNSTEVPGKDGKEARVFERVNGKDLKIMSRAKDRAAEKQNELSK